MSFKVGNVGCPCCDNICEIGFYGDVISQVVNAFPNAHGNANVNDSETINSAVWGANENKRLDIFYYGYTFGDDSCDELVQPFELSGNPFAFELGQFMLTHGGKILCVAENTAPIPEVSVGCWEDDDVDTFNDFISYMGSGSQRLQKDRNLDAGCQANTNIVTSHYDPFWQAIIDHMNNGVTQINVGGCSAVTKSTAGGYLLMSVEDDSQAVISIEKLGAGYIMIICDSNMFDSCIEGGTSDWGEEQEDGNFKTFLGNLCSLPDFNPDGEVT